MKRSRKGVLGLLALVVVAALGLGGCSDPGVEGWHDVQDSATPFAYGPTGCKFKLTTQIQPAGGAKTVVITTTPAVIGCTAAIPQIKIVRVSCMYLSDTAGLLVRELDGDTCPNVNPGGTELWLWVNAGYAKGPTVNG